MKFSHFFTGKPYHEIEKNADALLQRGEYGFAKLEYEKALLKLPKKTPEAPEAEKAPEAAEPAEAPEAPEEPEADKEA